MRISTDTETLIRHKPDRDELDLLQKSYTALGDLSVCNACGNNMPKSSANKRYCSETCTHSAHSFRRRVTREFAPFLRAGFRLFWLNGVSFEIVFPRNSWFDNGAEIKATLPRWAFNRYTLISGKDAVQYALEELLNGKELTIFNEAMKQWKTLNSDEISQTIELNKSHFLHLLEQKFIEFDVKPSFECCICHDPIPNLAKFRYAVSCGNACLACSFDDMPF